MGGSPSAESGAPVLEYIRLRLNHGGRTSLDTVLARLLGMRGILATSISLIPSSPVFYPGRIEGPALSLSKGRSRLRRWIRKKRTGSNPQRPCRPSTCWRCAGWPPKRRCRRRPAPRSPRSGPEGCSISSVFGLSGGRSASAAAGDPGSRQAVATLTAPSTPMVAWQRCGMKVRVAIAPPCCGALTMVIFGTVLATTLPRFISGPQARRRRSSRIFSAGVGVQRLAALGAGDPGVCRAQHDAGHAVVDQRDLEPVDPVARPAGRQQRAAGRAGGVPELQGYRRGGARHPVDPCVSPA